MIFPVPVHAPAAAACDPKKESDRSAIRSACSRKTEGGRRVSQSKLRLPLAPLQRLPVIPNIGKRLSAIRASVRAQNGGGGKGGLSQTQLLLPLSPLQRPAPKNRKVDCPAPKQWAVRGPSAHMRGEKGGVRKNISSQPCDSLNALWPAMWCVNHG
jgi:hypothetical protein